MTEGLQTALDQLWVRFLPEIRQRTGLIEAAARALGSGGLSAGQQAAAHAAAHKLAGTLGTFGLPEGTALAREAEQLLGPEAAPGAETAPRLGELAAGLGAVADSR
jgi:HPt (histidine-containing phosphotransfer) domain-containing protein